jgi:low temperature requirement protein LtrA
VFVQMAGVLVVAAGIPRGFDDGEYGVVTLGYVVMRLGLVAQWLRAAASHPEGRGCALRYAAGIGIVQVGWVARLALPDGARFVGFVVLALLEMAVPVLAEASGRTPWNPRHIAERYGLFTLIVLGESVLAATVGVQVALDTDASVGDLATVVVGGLLTVFAMWWMYFDMPAEQVVERARSVFSDHLRGAFAWGYGHYLVFAAAAAVGAGLAVAVDHATHHSELDDWEAGLAVSIPVSVYLLVVWTLHAPLKDASWHRNWAVPLAVALVLLASATPEPVLGTGIVLALLVATGVWTNQGRPAVTRPGHAREPAGAG